MSSSRYVWLQADDDITITFALQDDVTKSDVEVVFTRDTINVSVKGKQLLSGPLRKPIAAGECTWTISGSDNKRFAIIF